MSPITIWLPFPPHVSWHSGDRKWRARLGRKFLGNFDTKDAAREAYLSAARAQHGEYVRAIMSDTVSFWLPFPVSTNNLFAHAPVRGRVRRFPTKQYKNWRKEAVIRIRSQRIQMFREPVVIKLALTPKDSRRRDASNYIKAVEDALVEARVLVDDSQAWVKSVIPYWCEPDPQHEGVVVTIRVAKLGGLFAAA